MDSVKRIPRQTEPARNPIAALRLTPELVRDADILVSYYDLVDWEQLDQAQCVSVQLQFQSSEAVQTANRILLEMAAGDPKIRNDLIRKIKTAFQQSGSPLDPDNIGAENSSRHSVDKILAAITAASSPSKFAEECIQAAHLHREISSDVCNTYRRNMKPGQKPPPRLWPHLQWCSTMPPGLGQLMTE